MKLSVLGLALFWLAGCSAQPTTSSNGASSAATTSASAGPDASANGASTPAASDTVEIVARLVDMGVAAPYCGVIHAIKTMKYEVVRVVRGQYEASYIYVAHGCPELAREKYKAGSGTLDAFRVGDLHHLVLRVSTEEEIDKTLNHPDRGSLPLYQSHTVDREPDPPGERNETP